MLYRYISKILETNHLIKDSEIYERLLLVLPEGIGSELWQQAKQWCLRDLLDLN